MFSVVVEVKHKVWFGRVAKDGGQPVFEGAWAVRVAFHVVLDAADQGVVVREAHRGILVGSFEKDFQKSAVDEGFLLGGSSLASDVLQPNFEARLLMDIVFGREEELHFIEFLIGQLVRILLEESNVVLPVFPFLMVSHLLSSLCPPGPGSSFCVALSCKVPVNAFSHLFPGGVEVILYDVLC